MRDLKLNIGQLLIIGFDGTEMSPRLASLLTKIQPAGVILFARNITGAAETHALLRECQKHVATPLFTCVDLEGGTVDRFRNVIGSAPSAAEVLATGSRTLFRKHGHVIGENCRALGFNVDFAPVLDLAYEASRAVMGSRAVSDDPKRVVAYAREFLRGLGEAGVLGCGKHFPGLGEATLDTHHELPSVEKPLRKLWDGGSGSLSLAAARVTVRHGFARGLSGGDKRMHSSIALKKVDHRHSAQEDWLPRPRRAPTTWRWAACLQPRPSRGEQAITSNVGYIRAGGDLALICHHEDFILRAHEAMIHEAERDRRFARRVRGIGAARACVQSEKNTRTRVSALHASHVRTS